MISMYATQLFLSESIMSTDEKRLTFGQIVDRVFWGLIVMIALWAGSQLKELTNSVQSLNSTMVALSVDVKSAKSDLDKVFYINEKQDDRLRALEIQLKRNK